MKPATLAPPADAAVVTAGSVAALTAGLVAGNDEAYRALHAAYAGRLQRYLIVVCRGDEAATQEALQQTLLRVARHARRFDHEADFWRWLAALARSAAVDAARREHRYAAALRRYLGWLRPPPAEPAGPDPLDRLDTLLAAGLEALPEADRELLLARYRAGRPVHTLAAAAGVSPKAMESRLARLRAQLRARLLDRLAHEEPA
ncbi:MAG: RNA polymerase sigma factor [Limisphaerales bacterium]